MDLIVVHERHSDVILILVGVVLAAGVSRLVKQVIAPFIIDGALGTHPTISHSSSSLPLLYLVFVVDEDAAFLKGSEPQIFSRLRVKFKEFSELVFF